MIVAGPQSARSIVVETTYLGSVFSRDATGSSLSGKLGQLPAKISYVRRPSRKQSALPNASLITSPMSSLKYGKPHPPCSNPPSRSSSGPPGACMTPSSVRKVAIVRVPIRSLLVSGGTGVPLVLTTNATTRIDNVHPRNSRGTGATRARFTTAARSQAAGIA